MEIVNEVINNANPVWWWLLGFGMGGLCWCQLFGTKNGDDNGI
jgi:hypothetical protein